MPRCNVMAWVVLVAAGCGSLVSPVTEPVSATLSAGNYSLNLNPGAAGGAGYVCGINGSPAPNTSVSIPVVLSQSGTGWSARPTTGADRGLVLTLSQQAVVFTGTATGAAFDGTRTVTFGKSGPPAEPAQLFGPTLSANLISGYTSGQIDFSSPAGTSFCTSYTWVLLPR